MQFKQLEAFRAVMLTGSMSAAAREIHTSQPNISRLIAQLEMHTGFKLFERVAGRLLPTPEAQAFFRDVDRAFISLKDLKISAKNIAQQGIGHLRVAAVPSIALTIMPAVLEQFSRQFPDTRVSLYMGNSVAVTQWMASNYCDLGISAYVADVPGTTVDKVATFQGVCVVPADHPLAATETSVELEDFRDEPFISLPLGDGTRRNIDAVFEEEGEDFRHLYYESPAATIICMMVGKGMGISIVNPLVAHSNRHTGIVVKPLKPNVPFSYYILSSAVHVRSSVAFDFIALLKQHLLQSKHVAD